MGWRQVLQKAHYITCVVVLNTAALVFALWLFYPGLLPFTPDKSVVVRSQAGIESIPKPLAALPPVVKQGKPVRIEIIAPDNGMHIDLPVEDGYFDPKSGAWTLTDKKAYFATPSMLANDQQGTTLIYGHNVPKIFNHLTSLKQHVGAYALVHTDTGKLFRYEYVDAKNLQPNDTSVFTDQGSPTLLIQTCTGNWSELRRMYRFSFVSVSEAAS